MTRPIPTDLLPRRLIFAISVVTIITVKTLHIWLALPAFSWNEALIWVPSFYTLDISLLLLLRALLTVTITSNSWLRMVTVCAASIWVVVLLILAGGETSFYAISGSEAHLRNANVLFSASGGKMMADGIPWLLVALTSLILVSLTIRNVCFDVGRLGTETVQFLFRSAHLKVATLLQICRGAINQECSEVDNVYWWKVNADLDSPSTNTHQPGLRHKIIGLLLLLLFTLSILRPTGNYPPSLSLPMPILQFFELGSTTLTPTDSVIPTAHGVDLCSLEGTTMADLPNFQWLSNGTFVEGFEDWDAPGRTHYNARLDPLQISNWEKEILPDLKEALQTIKIRHVVLILLESTRADVFPLHNGSVAWKSLVKSYPTSSLVAEAEEVLANMSMTAKYLVEGRGGLYATNALTTSSYTLKSMVGTLCGVTPIPKDNLVEHMHHIYQPCLPQIFRMLNKIEQTPDQEEEPDDFSSFKWTSRWMQSVIDGYDHQVPLMAKLGYRESELVTKRYLRSKTAKFGPETEPDISSNGMPEVVLEKYIREAFQSATDNNERLFLSHLTGTSHFPYATPKDDPQRLPNETKKTRLVRYLSSIDYVDRWLKTILNILDEQKVTNETLVVFVGDHGLSIAEDLTVTPYGALKATNFHVPMIFSHPQLPKTMHIDDPVVSLQILPTILDLLQSTNSLAEQSRKAAQDLIANYEGQSLLRPLQPESAQTNHVVWQFSIGNPGGRTLLMRDARHPERRLFLPLVDGEKYRYADLREDPGEAEPIFSFTLPALIDQVESRYGSEIKDWISEADCAAQWWRSDSTKRWQGPASR